MKRFLLCSILSALPLAAQAVDVSVVGVFPGKAVLVLDGGSPRIVAVGQTANGVKVVAVEGDVVTLEQDGRRSKVPMGGAVSVGGGGGTGQVIHLQSDGRGHFVTPGSINGSGVTFLVDTGASSVAMGQGTARAAGIDYLKGERGMASTANGVVPMYRVRLSRVTIGSVTLTDVEGAVVQVDMPHVLLGMSFLNRMEMRREGQVMTLRKRF
ncbi:retropepsin-like aspartic protease family protein [Uliginosibacterium sp. H1]|uniref:retropepsin-like aspartic protease family protein n=1 Tax=Uliginosibacterium sp. H1 TaxID=3114757 RepID=UPI002E187CA3|nr:TIGR02281 family clan AA aspartic protease [Uliginosibacterium sp. H1]